jgi:dUTP pyrophosphatase
MEAYIPAEDASNSCHPKVPMRILNVTNGSNPLPSYGTELSSGFDLIAYLPNGNVNILPGEWKLISSGIKVSIPVGYELQIRSRSGLALKNGISVLNSPGTIDADFLGQIGIILMNSSKIPFEVSNGMRIAQAVLCPVVQTKFVVCFSEDELGMTVRGQGGFGSTGV